MKKILLLVVWALSTFLCSLQAAKVTVTIDMSSYSGASFTNVMMNGGFKGWGDAVALTTDNDSLVWSAVVTMNAGVNDYRFEIGGGEVGWTAEWESKSSTGECFVNPEGNASNMRWISVNGDATLPTVSWESCELKTSGTTQTLEEANSVYFLPNPVSDYLYVPNLASQATITILNLSGQQILKQSVWGNEKMDIHPIASGMYLVKIESGKGERVLKMV